MALYTEKTIEAWLERETRYLPMPNGSIRPHTTFRLVWRKVDALVAWQGWTLTELTGLAMQETVLQRISFEEAFDMVIAVLDDRPPDSQYA